MEKVGQRKTLSNGSIGEWKQVGDKVVFRIVKRDVAKPVENEEPVAEEPRVKRKYTRKTKAGEETSE